MSQHDGKVPAHFICPLSMLIMEYPVVTSKGHTYEYCEIERWLQKSDIDPLTNDKLPSKSLTPNHAMKSQIQEWLTTNPEAAARIDRNGNAHPYAPSGGIEDGKASTIIGLDSIVEYIGESPRVFNKDKVKLVPEPVVCNGRTYEFRRAPIPEGKGAPIRGASLETRRIDQSSWVSLPLGTDCLYGTPDGILFYKQNEVLETRVLPEDAIDPSALCKFKESCTNEACKFSHPYPCPYGISCRNKDSGCNRIHPEPCSVVPLEADFPRNKECKYGVKCTNETCHFAHPKGRCRVQRLAMKLFLTHDHDLNPLPERRPLDIGKIPAAATKWTFQGEFAFFFTPYAGAWAREQHFQKVAVNRFSTAKGAYCHVTEYELSGHYCNAAVGKQRYLTLSWWPYESEAMRTL
mmetsp:Transcript_13745/g.22908  ORF Transcript_13745/g.22908 Transcript_13745/m.22908 type:complete len:405 (+) Transcript_13745:292-1506(+)